MRISLGYELRVMGGYEIRLIDDQSTPTMNCVNSIISDKLDRGVSVLIWFLIPVPATYTQLRAIVT